MFLSLAVAGNLFLRGRAVEFKISRSVLKQAKKQPGLNLRLPRVGGNPNQPTTLAGHWLRCDYVAGKPVYTLEVPEPAEVARTPDGAPFGPVTGTGRVSYQVDLSFETLETMMRERHGLLMVYGGQCHSTVQCVDGADVVRVTVYPGKTKWEGVGLGSDGELHPVGSFTPEREAPPVVFVPGHPEAEASARAVMRAGSVDANAVKSSEFGLAPQVGKALLDGLKQLRSRLTTEDSDYAQSLLHHACNGIDKLIAEAETPGLSVPAEMVETFMRPDKLAETIGDSFEAVEFDEMFDRLDKAAAVIESEVLAAWSAKMRKWMGRLIDTSRKVGELRDLLCPHWENFNAVFPAVRELKEENEQLHRAANCAMAEVLAAKGQATFDAEAVTLDDGPDVWDAMEQLAPHVARSGDGAWYKLKVAIEAATPEPPSVPRSNAELHNEFE